MWTSVAYRPSVELGNVAYIQNSRYLPVYSQANIYGCHIAIFQQCNYEATNF